MDNQPDVKDQSNALRIFFYHSIAKLKTVLTNTNTNTDADTDTKTAADTDTDIEADTDTSYESCLSG